MSKKQTPTGAFTLQQLREKALEHFKELNYKVTKAEVEELAVSTQKIAADYIANGRSVEVARDMAIKEGILGQEPE